MKKKSLLSIQPKLGLEQLEPRKLLSVTRVQLNPTSPNLVIEGSNLDDMVTVSEDVPNVLTVSYTCDGQQMTDTFSKSLVQTIIFHGFEGNDTFTNQTDIKTIAYGNEGNDILVGGLGDDDIWGGDGDDVIRGGAGADILRGDGGADLILGEAGDDKLDGGLQDDQILGGKGNDILHGREGNDNLFGEEGNDIINGNEGDDTLDGDIGDDALLGNDGNDILRGDAGIDDLRGDAGDDWIEGGDGNDLLVGGLDNDSLFGGEGNDTLHGDEGADDLAGNNGNDVLYGHGDNDDLRGGDGDDELWGGEGDDVLVGWSGADTLRGEAGEDTLLGGIGNDILKGGDGNDHITGNEGDDTLFGGVGNDILYGTTGNDELRGEAGDDSLYGGSDDDDMWGGDGTDFLKGNGGADTLRGEGGNDTLVGGSENDILRGGDDNDHITGNEGDDFLFGGLGNDILYGTTGDDELNGEAGDDTLSGGSGNDELYGELGRDILHGYDGIDTLHGGDGDDTLRGGTDNDVLYGQEGNDTLYGEQGNDTLDGGADIDFLYGNEGNDILRGGDGDDELHGQAGEDYLEGNDGNDSLYGEEENDQLHGGNGNDVLSGADGDDTITGGTGEDTITGGAGQDDLDGGFGIDTVLGGHGNDTIDGGDGNDVLEGNDGNDTLNGGNGDDNIDGGTGDDIVNGQADNDFIHGGLGNDTLNGQTGVDAIYGGEGNDSISGQEGNDVLYGGAGNDIILGKDGNDLIFGAGGVDTIYGGNDNDTISGGADLDFLYGEAGSDSISGNQGDDFIVGGTEDDQLFGNEGRDVLQGLSGNDLIYGGEGNDELLGGNDNDQLFGEEGDDTIDGALGDDLLSGGDGADDLQAGGGQDVLIGGDQIDTLNGSGGEDLLIGGIVTHDFSALDALLATWSGPLSYDQRILAIEDTNFAGYLASHDTVMEDYVPDSVTGNDGKDWFFLPGVLGVYDVAGTGGGHGGGGHGGGHHHGGPVLLPHAPIVEGFALIDSLDHLEDKTEDESLHTLIPHGEDTVKRQEHLALFELVRYDQVTHTALNDGDWSNPATWQNGIVPSADARVLIPVGVEVTVDGILLKEVFSIRIDGTLSFATHVNTELRVDTIVGSASSTLRMGTTTQPIAANVTARMVFTDNGAIDRTYDPFGMSRGFITHGTVEVNGAAKTNFLEATGNITAGQSVIQLASTPVGWNVGDSIIIAGTSSDAIEDETRTILAINGNQVTVAPLAYDHLTPAANLNVHVANLTRNVVFESEGTDIDRRGHTMFMHNRDAHVANAAFNQLGRTDKSIWINDSVVDENWQLVAGTGTNQRARYSVHFHRNGTLADGNPSTITGSVVNDSPGWGFTNHSSYVDMTGNVSVNVNGAGFATEVGDETGTFSNNFSLSNTGTEENDNDRISIQDFGHTGAGFWFQGAGITVVDNIAASSEGSGFIFYTRGLIEGNDGLPAHYLTANLDDPSIANGEETILVDHVPVKEFQRNEAYSSDIGFTIRYHKRTATHNAWSTFENSTFWNNEVGMDIPYTKQTILRDITIKRDISGVANSIGINSNPETADIIYDNLDISGYYLGIVTPRSGANVVWGGTFQNRSAIVVRPAVEANSEVRVEGPITFVPLPAEYAHPGQWEVEMRFSTALYQSSTSYLYLPRTTIINYGPHTNRHLYFAQQAADAIPFPVSGVGIPAEYIGLTTQQLYDLYGLIPSNMFAPAGAVSDPNFIGLLDP